MKVETVDLGSPVHYADFGGDGPPIVLLHGLGGSHLNWMSIGPLLAKQGRVLAIDLPGFGLSPPGEQPVTVQSVRATVESFIRLVVGGPVTLFGNSMGGLIASLTAADAPELVERLMLISPAQPLPSRVTRMDLGTATMFALYAVPRLGELYVSRAMAKLGPERVARELLDRCCADVSVLPEEVVQKHVALAEHRAKEMPWGETAYLSAARSLLQLIVFKPGAVRDAMARIRVPGLIIHGEQDRLVPIAASRAFTEGRPGWTLEVFPDAGHVAMMEHPERVVDTYTRWAEGLELRQTG